jgi:hypothetical protein
MMRAMVGLLLLLISSPVSFGENPGSAAKNLPQIVGRFKRIHQTDAIPATVLFTPRSSGLFRISGTFLLRTAAGDGIWHVLLSWKDNKNRGWLIADVKSGGLTPLNNPWVFAAHAGEPVTLTITPQGDVSGSVYDAFYVIERLTKIPGF